MELDLTANEVRALFSLVEKALTTPDQYPLSTNALRSACNQKTSRDPVMDLGEAEVDAAVLSLRERGLARSLRPTGSRSWKHRHVINEVLPLPDSHIMVLAVLGLRDAQTPGELRQRTDRMHTFETVEEVDAVLADLAERPDPLVRNLGRQPGQSQDRWVHCLGEAAVPASESKQRALASEFRTLHDAGFFAMPNPWDRGSARLMQERGAVALATTSAGFGRAIGKDDQLVTRDELVAHVADLTTFIDIPLNVDSERLYPEAPGGIERTVQMLADAGAAGVSIEDYNPTSSGIDGIDEATEAVHCAVEACARHGVVLTARAENYLYGHHDLDDTIERLVRYGDAGADCLYAPGLRDLWHIDLVISETNAPINVLTLSDGPSHQELAMAGVRRISSGSSVYNAAANATSAATDAFLGRSPT
ncbi:MAG: 2-methylisocitrate lyase-like PEP mutase family enzyme [Verrucomicrobiales bacterium]|jgi:2-methylisocitrate lyase-like PEP mutase family enzyme/uncharacterized protein YceH (UPF0502 family)